MFGMGPWEIMIIAVVALVIFGPDKLPEVAGQLGRAVRDFRKMTSELTGEFEKTMNVADDIKQAVRNEVAGITAEVTSITESVKRDLSETVSGSPSSGASSGTVAAASSTTRKILPLATKADPLTDVSALDDRLISAKASTGGRRLGTKSAGIQTVAPVVAAVDSTAPTSHEIAALSPARTNGAAIDGDSHALESEPAAAGAAPLAAMGAAGDAVARARQRRQGAGYNRRRAS